MRRSAVFLLCLVSTAFLSALAAWSDDDARFLGMAVATSIGRTADGLTVLNGIHHAVRVDTLPAIQDLRIYTRWSGGGEHTIGVSFWSADNEVTLAETAEDVDFGQDPITYCTYDFPATRFTKPGVYAVEVTLDGDTAAEYEFFVNAEDQFPESPEFALSVPAETGSVNDAGDASVSGIFEYFAFDSFPTTDSFAIVSVWFSGDGQYQQYTRILDPKGAAIAVSPARTLSASHGEMSVMTDTFDGVVFSEPGTYTAVIYLDGQEVFEYPLAVIKG